MRLQQLQQHGIAIAYCAKRSTEPGLSLTSLVVKMLMKYYEGGDYDEEDVLEITEPG